MLSRTLFVTVRAGVRVERVRRIAHTEYIVWVRARPEKGRANERVVALLAQELRVRTTDVAIVRGETSNRKVLEVRAARQGQ
jgi:uncharacterized protein YggU (UPF0235/DUF167 family)